LNAENTKNQIPNEKPVPDLRNMTSYIASESKTSMKENLQNTQIMTPDHKKSKGKIRKPIQEEDDTTLGAYNAEICQIMNEFYHSPATSKAKIASILEEVSKSLNDKDTANSVFIAVFQNIKVYMKEIRALLYARLKELGLAQPIVSTEEKQNKKIKRRRHSADSLYEYSEDAQDVNLGSNTLLTRSNKEQYSLKPFREAPQKYIEFLITLCQTYKNLVEITSNGVEQICQEILFQCKLGNEVTSYDIHKSLFYDYILKDRLIIVFFLWSKFFEKMAITDAKCYFTDEKIAKAYPKLRVVLGAIRKIKQEIRKCRVKITIGKGNNNEEYFYF